MFEKHDGLLGSMQSVVPHAYSINTTPLSSPFFLALILPCYGRLDPCATYIASCDLYLTWLYTMHSNSCCFPSYLLDSGYNLAVS